MITEIKYWWLTRTFSETTSYSSVFSIRSCKQEVIRKSLIVNFSYLISKFLPQEIALQTISIFLLLLDLVCYLLYKKIVLFSPLFPSYWHPVFEWSPDCSNVEYTSGFFFQVAKSSLFLFKPVEYVIP